MELSVALESMFAGLRRLNIGEMLVYEGGQATVVNVWHPIQQSQSIRLRKEAVARLKDILKDRIRRYSRGDIRRWDRVRHNGWLR